MGGGCVGCAQVDVTLRQGVEVAIKRFVPEIVAIVYTTDLLRVPTRTTSPPRSRESITSFLDDALPIRAGVDTVLAIDRDDVIAPGTAGLGRGSQGLEITTPRGSFSNNAPGPRFESYRPEPAHPAPHPRSTSARPRGAA
jgi:hypothetical protein